MIKKPSLHFAELSKLAYKKADVVKTKANKLGYTMEKRINQIK